MRDILSELERKILWLSTWTIHNANHLRAEEDAIKVGGHQASSASLVSIMTALYLGVLKPQDRVAVKPHASPVFHAIQYLLGNQTREKLEAFRAFGGAQSYPSRTKDVDDVDISTGSVGLGVAMTAFTSLTQDYLAAKGLHDANKLGRMIALVGDAELDEGNIYETLIEGYKHSLRNTWWIIDYNRQSLDGIIREGLYTRFEEMFRATGWDVVTLKYGRQMEKAFAKPGGEDLRKWIDEAPNDLYSALTFRGGAAWRERLHADLGRNSPAGRLIDDYDDDALSGLMCNLGGHDLDLLLDTFLSIDHDRPICFIAYTIKGMGLPLAGHKDNHSGLLTPTQMEQFRATMGVREGHEWEKFEGLTRDPAELQAFLDKNPFNAEGRRQFRGAASRCSRSHARPHRAGNVDAGRLRPHSVRSRPRAERVCETHRDDLAGRHRLDQSRRLGQSPRRLRSHRDGRPFQGTEDRVDLSLVIVAAGSAHRARNRGEQSFHLARSPRAFAFAIR